MELYNANMMKPGYRRGRTVGRRACRVPLPVPEVNIQRRYVEESGGIGQPRAEHRTLQSNVEASAKY